MPVVTIINRTLRKSVASARCLSWYSNYLHFSSKQTVNRDHNNCLTKKSPVVTSSASFQCRFKYDKSSNKKGDDEVGTRSTVYTDKRIVIRI